MYVAYGHLHSVVSSFCQSLHRYNGFLDRRGSLFLNEDLCIVYTAFELIHKIIKRKNGQ